TDVAGTFTIAEQTTLDPVGPGQHGHLRGGHAGASVVVGVHTDQQAVAAPDVATEPRYRVRILVRHAAVDGGRQVENQRVLRSRIEYLDDRVADVHRKV